MYEKYGKLKHCPDCDMDLPMLLFSSVQAKRCENCKTIRKLKQQNEMTARALGRSQNKKQKKEQVISIADLKKKVQREVNKYVKLRDKNLKCISCEIREVEHAGHYIAQGSSGLLRYTLENINGQCSQCNVWLHGNLISYRIGLCKKIGENKVKELEDARFLTKKWTRENLEQLLQDIKEKIKEL